MKRLFSFIILLVLFAFNGFGQQNEEVLKVITYNIWSGFDWGNDEARRENVSEWINEQNPSIVGLQELCKYSSEKLKEDAKNWGHDYSVLLKKNGYSVGLTSKYPIEIIEKILENMHHGALHCKTGGIDIFVVHFSPSSYKKRRLEAEIILEKLTEVAKKNTKYLVMGDFNAHSPFDANLYKNNVLLNRLRKSNADKAETGNLVDNELDFAVISKFLAFPLIDVCLKFTNGMDERGSFPGRSLGVTNDETDDELIRRLERIDFILVSPKLGNNCINAEIFNGEANWYLSDHYPVGAKFKLE